MQIEYRQISKSLYGAEFVIKEPGEHVIGSIKAVGSMASINAEVTIIIPGSTIILKPAISPNKRSYNVIRNGEPAGQISIVNKGSLFKRRTVYELDYFGNIYIKYLLGFGSEGLKQPIYNNADVQKGLIEKDCEVINGLHIFNGYMKDKDFLECLSIFVAYTYAIGFYTPGEMVTEGKQRFVRTTKDKELLQKYDPGFKKECSDEKSRESM